MATPPKAPVPCPLSSSSSCSLPALESVPYRSRYPGRTPDFWRAALELLTTNTTTATAWPKLYHVSLWPADNGHRNIHFLTTFTKTYHYTAPPNPPGHHILDERSALSHPPRACGPEGRIYVTAFQRNASTVLSSPSLPLIKHTPWSARSVVATRSLDLFPLVGPLRTSME